jgi:hypothetical protein
VPAIKDEVYTIADDPGISIDELFKTTGSAPSIKLDQPASSMAPGARPARTGPAPEFGEGAAPSPPTNKSAPLAASLSLFICGGGQIYNGQVKLGALFMLGELLAVVGHWSLFQLWGQVVELAAIFEITEAALVLSTLILDSFLLIFLVAGVSQAYKQAEAWGRPFDGIGFAPLSGAASALVPGWGQLLNAQAGKATFFLSVLAIMAYAGGILAFSPMIRELVMADLTRYLLLSPTSMAMAAAFGAGTLWAINVYDAFLVARYQR